MISRPAHARSVVGVGEEDVVAGGVDGDRAGADEDEVVGVGGGAGQADDLRPHPEEATAVVVLDVCAVIARRDGETAHELVTVDQAIGLGVIGDETVVHVGLDQPVGRTGRTGH